MSAIFKIAQSAALAMATSIALAGCSTTSGTAASAVAQEAIAPAEQRPNIVLLFVDDLAWLDVGYRSEFIETPSLDKFRTESISFERAYPSAPVCSPSRVGLITGQHSARHKFFRHVGAAGKDTFDEMGRPPTQFHVLDSDPAQMPSANWLPLEARTIAERLDEADYRTVFVGKWHIGHEPYHPDKQGFDEQYGVTNFGSPNAGYYPPYWKARPDVYTDAPADQFLTDRITDDAVSVITNHDDADGPLFLNLWYYGVHKPIRGNKELMQKYLDRGIAKEQAEYASMVESIDQSIARIDAALQARGIAENTIVVFTSDQGGYFPRAPLRGKKNDGEALFEGGARVPLYIRWPGVFEPGDAYMHPVSLLDIAPTLMRPAGAAMDDLDGKDLVMRHRTQTEGSDPVVMYRHYEDRYAAVVDGTWKFIATVSGEDELYDLVADPAEQNSIASSQPERVAQMAAILEEFRKKQGLPMVGDSQ